MDGRGFSYAAALVGASSCPLCFLARVSKKAPPKGHLGRGLLGGTLGEGVSVSACNERSRSCHSRNLLSARYQTQKATSSPNFEA